MRPFLKNISIILLAGGLSLSLLDIFYTWAITRRPLFWIEKDQHYDYLIAGDSRTSPLLTPYLEMITGKKTINIGYPAFTLEDNRRVLKYFFDRGNRADTVYLQIDLRFGTATDIRRDWYYRPYLVMQEGMLTPRVPFKYYAENNKNITLRTIGSNLNYHWSKHETRDAWDTSLVVADYRPFQYNDKLLADHSHLPFLMDELKSFRRFLSDHGVSELVLFTAPYSPNWFHSQRDTSNYKKLIRAEGFIYHDLSGLYSDTTYFKDYTHIKNNRYLEFCRDFNDRIIRSVAGESVQRSAGQVSKTPLKANHSPELHRSQVRRQIKS